MTNTRQILWDVYSPPFKADVYGSRIVDDNNNLVCDEVEDGKLEVVISLLNNHWKNADSMSCPISFRVRGWGRIQKMDNPETRQDQVEARITGIIHAYHTEEK